MIIVSGAPGAGKSTLAGPLAAELGFPLLSKDVIKETLFDQLGHVADDERRSSQQLGGAAMELLWRLASACPAVVLEANFRSRSSYEREPAPRADVTTGGGVLPSSDLRRSTAIRGTG